MTPHEFGGSWTEDKLSRLQKYLQAYMIIFSKNERAWDKSNLCGCLCGYGLSQYATRTSVNLSFPELTEPDNQEFLKGSACIALEVPEFAS